MNSNRAVIGRRDFLSVMVLIVTATCGCSGSSDGPARIAVDGTVTLAGQPVSGSLSLTPLGEGPATGAEVQAGAFSIPQNRGPVAGRYRVSLSTQNVKSIVPDDGVPPAAPQPLEVDIDESGKALELAF